MKSAQWHLTKETQMILRKCGDHGPLFIPDGDNEGETYKRGGKTYLFTNLADEYRGRLYEKLGLAFRNTPLSSEIKARLEHRPVEVEVSLEITLSPDKKTYGIFDVTFNLVYGELQERNRNRDRIGWTYVGDEQGQKRFGFKPMHVFNELKGTSWK